MGTFKKNYWTFCGCLFMFTENWNKTGEITAILILLWQSVYKVSHPTFKN